MNILDDKNLKEIIYSILFVAGDGIEKSFIAEKLDISKKDLDKALEELKKELSGDKGVHLIEYKDKVQLATNPNYASYISDVLNPIREKSLTRAALETLAIIAYKQPITKLDIEDIRGVNSDYAVQILIDQNMIEVVGRKDAVGKPLLFGTTDNFLKRFDIKNVSDLPDYDELLERIKTIRAEEDENSQNTLFRNVDDLEFNEELPDYLKDENFQKIEADGNDNFNEEPNLLKNKDSKKEKKNKIDQSETNANENSVDETDKVDNIENKEDKVVKDYDDVADVWDGNEDNKDYIELENKSEESSKNAKIGDSENIATNDDNKEINNNRKDKILEDNDLTNEKIDLSKLAELADSDLDDDIVIGSVDVSKLRALFNDNDNGNKDEKVS